MNQDNSTAVPDALGGDLKSAIRRDQLATGLFDETLAQFLGINATDGRCLEIISLSGSLTAGQIAEQARLTTGAVTTLLDRLERAGYVRRVRDDGDRRKVWIETTPLLDTITRRIFSQYAEIGALTMGYFSADELRAITRFLEMNAAVTRARARLLARHMVPPDSRAEARQVEARAFERDTEIMSRKASTAHKNGQPITDDTFGD